MRTRLSLLATAAAAWLLPACATQPAPSPEPPPQLNERRTQESQPGDRLARSREILLKDAREILGAAAFDEVMRAPTAMLVRTSYSLPQMIQQPDGSWKPPPPGIAAAIQQGSAWVRIGAAGTRTVIEPAAAAQLDRLLARPGFWSEPPNLTVPCTDPSGIVVLARDAGREFLSPFPCGFTGLAGEAAELVLSGRVTDWNRIDPDLRPAGVPLARFDEATESHFRFSTGLYEERMIPIRSEAAWQGQWMRMMRPKGEVPPLPPVDFTREMLLMAAMGPQASGGYRVEIQRVIDQGHELLAFVRFTSPGPRCGAIAAITSPVDIVRVPRSEKNIRWVVERVATDCP